MKKYIITSLVSILSLQACSSEDDSVIDTQKPVIVLNSPSEHQIFQPGEEIQLDAVFTDNLELGSYKIEIHSGTDGHSHKGILNETQWFYNETAAIEPGLTQKNILKSIPIPTEINGSSIHEGHYHLGIYLIDRAGNQQELFIEIVIGEDHDH